MFWMQNVCNMMCICTKTVFSFLFSGFSSFHLCILYTVPVLNMCICLDCSPHPVVIKSPPSYLTPTHLPIVTSRHISSLSISSGSARMTRKKVS